METLVADHLQPRIYVACLAAYNSGYLHGVWIDATRDVWAMHDAIAAMLRASPIVDAEEYAIHDYEGFEGITIGEYASLDSVADYAAFVTEHGRLGAALLEHVGFPDEARDALENRYAGVYASLADFARELTEDTTSIPDNLRYYIDYELMARDMAISDIFTIETGFEQVHVFWSR